MENILHRKSFLKTLVVFLSSLMLATILVPTGAALAQEEENTSANIQNQEANSEEVVQELADELQFYFGEVGELTEDGDYIFKNPELLKERAQSGDEYAAELYSTYINNKSQSESSEETVSTYNLGYDFAACVIDDVFGFYIGILSGDVVQTLVGYISDQAWTAAGSLLVQYAGGLIGSSTATGIAANLAVASATCGLQQIF